tara:strand:- start:140 stop:712 length:573 start_codon:yes stop_codon:yes gene_type:complete
METVSFTRMEDGTKEDYELLFRDAGNAHERTICEVIGYLENLRGSGGAFKIDRLEHSLQTATIAYRDEADEEMVVAALVHDIGDFFAPMNHGDFAASILKPYVSEQTYWVVKYHAVFQAYYYAHHIGRNRNAREKYTDSPNYQACIDFCHKWDQAAFDPDYETMSLDEFGPMVERVFSRKPYSWLDQEPT